MVDYTCNVTTNELCSTSPVPDQQIHTFAMYLTRPALGENVPATQFSVGTLRRELYVNGLYAQIPYARLKPDFAYDAGAGSVIGDIDWERPSNASE